MERPCAVARGKDINNRKLTVPGTVQYCTVANRNRGLGKFLTRYLYCLLWAIMGFMEASFGDAPPERPLTAASFFKSHKSQ
jgi:hypothetical protein